MRKYHAKLKIKEVTSGFHEAHPNVLHFFVHVTVLANNVKDAHDRVYKLFRDRHFASALAGTACSYEEPNVVVKLVKGNGK